MSGIKNSPRAERKKRALMRKGGLLIAIAAVAAILGLMIWLMIHIINKGSESGDSETKLKTVPVGLSQSSSAAESSSKKEDSSKAQEVLSAPKLDNNNVIAENGAVTLKWDAVKGAEGYTIYRTNDGKTEKFQVKGDQTSYEDKAVEAGKTYTYSVTADAAHTESKSSDEIQVKTPAAVKYKTLYFVPKGTAFYNDNLTVYKTTLEDCYFTGAPDEKNKGYIRMDAEFTTKLVKSNSKGLEAQKNTKTLATGNIGQEGGTIFGSSACGPAAAAVLVQAEKGEVWNKDELITFTEKNKLSDQGSMTGEVGKGGMSAPMVIKLIEMYSKGRYTARNSYDPHTAPSKKLVDLIDNGQRCILSVRYAWGIVHHPYSIIHFVTIAGYQKASDGKTYFYYCDTAHGNDIMGLKKVEASELDKSVLSVEGEPICMITLD